jgi:uncharacterized protein (TIGR03435 family)
MLTLSSRRPPVFPRLRSVAATSLALSGALALCLAGAAHAQTPAPLASPANAPASALTFEVAAIKLNQSGSGNSNSDTDKGLFTATNESLKNLMQWEAYDIPASRILGGPKWLDSTRFDIEAKMDEATATQLKALDRQQSRIESMAMFQQLLADRFKLAVHWETRELPVYALAVAKNGAKLQAAKDASGNSGTSVSSHDSAVQFKATGQTLEQLAQSLSSTATQELGREVIDKTGIQGKYDFALNWTRDSGATAPAPDGSAKETSPSIFTAIQEQLGLKLEPSKGPVRVLVVDHAEMPSAN